MDNLWLDMISDVKIPILKKAVEYGWIKESFVQEFILLEEQDALSRKEKEKKEKR